MKKISLLAMVLLMAQITFAQSTNPAPYCDASFDDYDGTIPVDDHISSVSFGSLLNVSNAQYAAPHYVFYNNLPAQNFTVDSTYMLGVTFRVAGSAGYGVWIDFNHNNTFEESEKIAGSSGTGFLNLGDSTVTTQNVVIPATASLGQTRMRVRIVEDDNYTAAHGAAIQPCNASTSASDVMDWGETEDYTVTIQAANPGGNNGIENEHLAAGSLRILPNPSNGQFVVVSDAAINHLEVYSIMGKQVYEKTGSGKRLSVDLSDCAKGIYLVRVNSQSRWTIDKVILN